MRLPEEAGDAATLGAGARFRPRRPRRPRGFKARRNGEARAARLAAGTLCGLGATLFPGLALLALQAVLVSFWALLMVSLVAGGLRGQTIRFR